MYDNFKQRLGECKEKSEESVFEEIMTEKCSNGESNGKIKTPKHVTVKPWMKRQRKRR